MKLEMSNPTPCWLVYRLNFDGAAGDNDDDDDDGGVCFCV